MLLSIRPDYDIATRYSQHWLLPVVKEARRIGIEVVDLYGKNANRRNFDYYSKGAKFIVGTGHGSETTYTGQNKEILLEAGVNERVVSGKDVYLFSCLTGAGLIPSLYFSGNARQAIGFSEEYTWLAVPPYDPSQDKYGSTFGDLAAYIGIKLLHGKSARDTAMLAKARADELISYWKKQDDPAADEVIKWLIHDRDAIVAYGKSGSVETPYSISVAPKPFVFPPLAAIVAGIGTILMFC